MTYMSSGSCRRAHGTLTLLTASLLASACTVDNPGQILDADLNNSGAFPQIVQGMHGDLQVGINNLTWRASVLYGELAGAGFHDDLQMYWRGETDAVFANAFNTIHAARWVADDGIRRMTEILGSDFERSNLAAPAYLWSGFAHRLLGDNLCAAVIDGGPVEDRRVYYERAEQRFSSAIEAAVANAQPVIERAARGGRASVRANMGNWPGALADAALVPDDFLFEVEFSTASTRSQNTIWVEHFQRQNSSVKYTYFEEYFNESGDRRVDNRNPLPGQAQLSADGRTPHRRQFKYTAWDSNIALTRGVEMRLLEAEAMLNSGNWTGAMAIINGIRAGVGVAPWPATNANEAMVALIKERAIVLWMEARRGGDYYRWGLQSENDPILQREATLVPAYVEFQLAGRDTCFPLSRNIMLNQ